MANQHGIAILIKAFLPTGKTLDEQFEALGAVKEAHKTGDYSKLLQIAKIEEVKTEAKTRRVEETPAPLSESSGTQEALTSTNSSPDTDASGLKAAFDAVPPVGDIDPTEPAGTVGGAQMEGEDDPAAEVPAFLKNSK